MISEQQFQLKKDGTCYKRSYCARPELIENYDKAMADMTHIWECHHRLETHTSDGERRLVDLTSEELIALDMYYNRPPEELIFLSTKDHHSYSKGKYTGEKNSFYGKTHSEESKIKMSEAKKKNPVRYWDGKERSEETKKKMAAAKKGKHWKLVDGKRVWY